MRRLTLILLVGLAACNRHGVADVTLDADAAQRNATQAKTLGDLAAADAASQGPVPIVRDARPAKSEAAAPRSADAAESTVAPDVPADADTTASEAQTNQ